MVEKLLVVEPLQLLRKTIVAGAHIVAVNLEMDIIVYSAQTLARAEGFIDSGNISLLITNLNLGEAGNEGLLLVDQAIPSGPKTPRERVCVYADNIPVAEIPPGVIQIPTVNISLPFLQAFIGGLTTNPN